MKLLKILDELLYTHTKDFSVSRFSLKHGMPNMDWHDLFLLLLTLH
jgi:hypothetical protein